MGNHNTTTKEIGKPVTQTIYEEIMQLIKDSDTGFTPKQIHYSSVLGYYRIYPNTDSQMLYEELEALKEYLEISSIDFKSGYLLVRHNAKPY